MAGAGLMLFNVIRNLGISPFHYPQSRVTLWSKTAARVPAIVSAFQAESVAGVAERRGGPSFLEKNPPESLMQ